jgi:hypothetical protein
MRQGALQESEAAQVSEESFRSANIMSALPIKAAMCGAARDVRFGPIADILNTTTISDNPRAPGAEISFLRDVLPVS